MFIFTTNLFSFPIIILIWLIELYLFLAATRLVMAAIPSTKESHLYQQLKLLTDFVPNSLSQKVGKCKDTPISSWLSWFIVLTTAFLLRQLLIVIITTNIHPIQ